MTSEYFEIIAGLFLIAIICVLVALGILANMFIVTINLNCWNKSQPLQDIDMIITSLAISRVILLFLDVLFIIDYLSDRSGTTMFPDYTITLTLSVEFCSLWWGSLLCVFYCVKITNYSNRFFIRLKMNISKMVPWMLLLSVVPSLLSSLPFTRFGFSLQSFNDTDNPTGVIKSNWFNYFMICFAGSFMPFLIFCFFVGLLIVSLFRHSRNLSSSGSQFTDAQRDIHFRVIWNMISFLLFYCLYFLGSNLFPISLIFKKRLFTLLCFILYVAFPSLHSITLIVGKRELKNTIFNILCQ